MKRMQTLKWIVLVVMLLILSIFTTGCLETFANVATGLTFGSPIGIFIQAFGPYGPATWVEQEAPNYCVMATCQTFGYYYGYWIPGLGPSQVNLSYAMTGTDTGNATPNELVAYMNSNFWQFQWQIIGYSSGGSLIHHMYHYVTQGDIATLSGGSGSTPNHMTTCVGVFIDSTKAVDPSNPDTVVIGVVASDPGARGTFQGGLTDISTSRLLNWIKPDWTANGWLYTTCVRTNFYKKEAGVFANVAVLQPNNAEGGSHALNRLLPYPPNDYEAFNFQDFYNDGPPPPLTPITRADTMTVIGQQLIGRSGIFGSITQNPWVADVLLNSWMTRAFQMGKGYKLDIPDYRWYVQLQTQTPGGDTLVVAEQVFDYDAYNKTITPIFAALYATPDSDGIPQSPTLKLSGTFTTTNALMRHQDVFKRYPGCTAVPFMDSCDVFPSEVKWWITRPGMDPFVINRGGVQMFWDPESKDFVYGDAKVSNAKVPTDFQLSQNFPNPFNPKTNITFSLPKQTTWTIDVVNIIGERVTQFTGTGVGQQTITWDASTFASGVYFYQLHTDDFTETKKMVLMK
jgi:hypothetical protein